MGDLQSGRCHMFIDDLNQNNFDNIDTFVPQTAFEESLVTLGKKYRHQYLARQKREEYLNKVLEIMMEISGGDFPEEYMTDFIQDVDDDDLTNAIMITLHMMAEELAANRNELVEAHDRAVEASQIKTQFLANMSHELRTPLNAVIGYSELVNEVAEESGLDEIVQDVDKILKSARHLLNLIADVLDIAKVESGKMELYIENFSVQQSCAQIVQTIEPLAKSKNNKIFVDIDPKLSSMRSDQTKLRQVLSNIMSNANKFTANGTLKFSAQMSVRENTEWVTFVIEDTGIGIEDKRLAAIFDPFTQADNTTTKQFGGTGLGLAISKQFVLMMGGLINVSSKSGQGSKFTVSLPLSVDGKSREQLIDQMETQTLPVNEKINILIVDDDPHVHELTHRFFANEPVKITSTYTGKQTFELLQQDILPDIIMLDVLLPDMDGQHILAKIKTDKRLKHIPVIVISMTNDKTMAFALGAADYLVKPINYDTLLPTLTKLLQPEEGAKILVAEDDDASRKMICRMLKNRGYIVHEAQNGQQVITYLNDENPSLILLDLNMPTVNGFEVIDYLQSTPKLSAIPVLVLTGMELADDDIQRLKHYKEDVMTKGVTTTDNLFLKIFSMISSQLA